MHRHDDLAEDLPQLAALSSDERRQWARALSARRSLGRAASLLSTGLNGVLLFSLSFFACVFVMFLIWLIADLCFGVGQHLPPAIRALAFFTPPIIFSLWMSLRLSARLNSLDRRRHRLAHLRGPVPTCARCGYNLSGAATLPARPGVLRCPECALINPAPTPGA